MKRVRGIFKQLCLVLAWPLYRQLQHEMLVEIQRLIQCQVDSHDQLIQHVSAQFFKLHHLIDEIRKNPSEQKIDTVLIELIKMRESIDRLKLEQHDKE